MIDSDSSLSSPPSTDDEMPPAPAPAKTAAVSLPKKKKKKKKSNGTILTFFKHRSASPPARSRPVSPPREAQPEDNPDIAFIVMFRSRFSEAFPRGAPSVGPQDIEQGVIGDSPSADVEGLLCALLGLVLNRKKPVEKGHYGRALEEAIQTQKSQWPSDWAKKNPLSGGQGFNTMSPTERITLLHTLALWSLNQNEQIKLMINNAYKSRTTKDRLDTNIPLSVQPWGRDGDKRRYWLVEGQNDTHFRIYRETDPKLKNVQWISVAGSIEEARTLATKLEEEDGHKEAKALGERMINAIPRFEASENKRKRREYRVQRNVAFSRQDPGFSLYEGRTRGKRQRYTFDEEEDLYSDDVPSRRSGRHSGRDSPAAQSGPTVTASGRHVKSRATGMYGETLHSGQVTDRPSPATGDYVRSDISEEPQQSRATRAGNRGAANGRGLKRAVDSDEEDDATSWDGGDEDEDEPTQMDLDDDEDGAGGETSEEADEDEPQSLMVTLRYRKGDSDPPSGPLANGAAPETATTNGAGLQSAYTQGAPLAGTGAPRQPELPLAPAQSQQVAPPTPSQQAYTAPIMPVAHIPASGNSETSPKPEGFFAPTPPYTAAEEAPKPQDSVQAPVPPTQALRNHTQPAATAPSGWQ
ncbi:hypothetical protein ACN47E_008026 [Coniothyrium glycines]